MLDSKFLEILACPYCKSDVKEEGDRLLCTRAECGLVYAVEDGIPIMLIGEASKPCPRCKAERDFTDEALVCKACGARFRFEPDSGSE